MYDTSQEAKKAGWFSRRHETAEAQSNMRQAREAKRVAKLQDRQKCEEDAAHRSPQEQLRRLDERLGVGVGATKERVRLKALIAK